MGHSTIQQVHKQQVRNFGQHGTTVAAEGSNLCFHYFTFIPQKVWSLLAATLGKLFAYVGASVTKQYNLVLTKMQWTGVRWCSEALSCMISLGQGAKSIKVQQGLFSMGSLRMFIKRISVPFYVDILHGQPQTINYKCTSLFNQH